MLSFLPDFQKRKVWPLSQNHWLSKQNVWAFYNLFSSVFKPTYSHCNAHSTLAGFHCVCKVFADCLSPSLIRPENNSSISMSVLSGWWTIGTIRISYVSSSKNSSYRISFGHLLIFTIPLRPWFLVNYTNNSEPHNILFRKIPPVFRDPIWCHGNKAKTECERGWGHEPYNTKLTKHMQYFTQKHICFLATVEKAAKRHLWVQILFLQSRQHNPPAQKPCQGLGGFSEKKVETGSGERESHQTPKPHVHCSARTHTHT